jgi:hypothetical protein
LCVEINAHLIYWVFSHTFFILNNICDEKVLVEEFGFKPFEALTLMIFARHGYLPKTHRREEP